MYSRHPYLSSRRSRRSQLGPCRHRHADEQRLKRCPYAGRRMADGRGYRLYSRRCSRHRQNLPRHDVPMQEGLLWRLRQRRQGRSSKDVRTSLLQSEKPHLLQMWFFYTTNSVPKR